MKMAVTTIVLGAVIIAACTKPTTQNVKSGLYRNAYFVELDAERLQFKGIDQPLVCDPRPDDKYADAGMHLVDPNLSKTERVLEVTREAIDEMRPLVKKTDTTVLLNSLRTQESLGDSLTDLYIARHGNWLILKELARRRPLKVKCVRSGEIYLGDQLPMPSPFKDLERLMNESQIVNLDNWSTQ